MSLYVTDCTTVDASAAHAIVDVLVEALSKALDFNVLEIHCAVLEHS
jgi:hypothetical protein